MAGNGPGLLKAILFVNLHKKNAGAVADEIRKELEDQGSNVTIFSFDGHPGSFPDGTWDIAFSLGGDGTVLYAARMLAPTATPILPVHLGTLGFLASVEMHEWPTVYQQWLAGIARLSRRCMFEISVERKGHSVYRNICLNDVVVSSLGIAKLIYLGVSTETAPGESADLGCYRADGLVVATPTGSTAYSMAAGGPIIDPEMEARIISPICPFSLSNRPLVLPSRQTLYVTVEREQKSGVLLTVDGQDTFSLEGGDTVIISHFPHYALLVTAGSSAYYLALRKKLAWHMENGSLGMTFGGGDA
ncbi:MAG: NAD(+)/NADH kinase [Treponema sp.]|nr:NAD(+)/NADH kinase [Treponema sp.]